MKSPYLLRAGVLVLLACSAGQSGAPNNSNVVDASAPGLSKDGGADASSPVNTEPEAWVTDKTVDCVGPYKTQAPKAGANEQFEVAGQSRSFQLLLPPPSYAGPRPLFVGFNGTSENGAKFAARAKLTEFAARGFVVLVPSSVGNGTVWPVWDGMRSPSGENDPNKDLAFFDAMVRCTAAHFSIDKKRLYVGGHSAGGIFANRVLRARSELLAGGIVGSGIWSLTGSLAAPELNPVFAIVTWGGDNDSYSGSTPSGVSVPRFNFVEQASLASKFYESLDGGGQVYCRGNNLGHAWLPLNDWFVDALLAHPKGLAAAPGMPVVPANVSTKVSCNEAAYELPPLADVVCKPSSKAGCMQACQLMADCAVENRTVGAVLEGQLQTLGFTATSCSGCVDKCEQSANTAANAAALSCFSQAQPGAICAPGIEGSFSMMRAVNECCQGRSDASFCVGLCSTLMQNEAASSFFPACAAIAR